MPSVNTTSAGCVSEVSVNVIALCHIFTLQLLMEDSTAHQLEEEKILFFSNVDDQCYCLAHDEVISNLSHFPSD